MSVTGFLSLFLPSCQWKFLFLAETEEKVDKRFQRFPQTLIQSGEGEEVEETVDDPDVEKEGAEEDVDQPSLKDPAHQEAQFVLLSLCQVFQNFK